MVRIARPPGRRIRWIDPSCPWVADMLEYLGADDEVEHRIFEACAFCRAHVVGPGVGRHVEGAKLEAEALDRLAVGARSRAEVERDAGALDTFEQALDVVSKRCQGQEVVFPQSRLATMLGRWVRRPSGMKGLILVAECLEIYLHTRHSARVRGRRSGFAVASEPTGVSQAGAAPVPETP